MVGTALAAVFPGSTEGRTGGGVEGTWGPGSRQLSVPAVWATERELVFHPWGTRFGWHNCARALDVVFPEHALTGATG